MIPQKPNLTHKCSRNSPGNPPILSPKQCQHRSLHSYECWLLFFRLYDTKVLGDILLSQTLFLYSYTVLNTAKTTHTSGWRCRRIRRLCTYNTLNNYYTASQAYAATLGMGKRTVVRLRKKQWGGGGRHWGAETSMPCITFTWGVHNRSGGIPSVPPPLGNLTTGDTSPLPLLSQLQTTPLVNVAVFNN